VKALKLILENNITRSAQLKLREWGLWEGGVEQFIGILNHSEPEALLGLTVKNNNNAVTKEDVVEYIKKEVTKRINSLQLENIQPDIIEKIEMADEILQWLEQLEGIVSSDQIMDISPQLRNIIISNPGVSYLIKNKKVTFDQVIQLHDKSPEKFGNVTHLIKLGVKFKEVNQLYNNFPETLEEITSYKVISLPPEEFQKELQFALAKPNQENPNTSINNTEVSAVNNVGNNFQI